jgi:hypothetical protein
MGRPETEPSWSGPSIAQQGGLRATPALGSLRAVSRLRHRFPCRARADLFRVAPQACPPIKMIKIIAIYIFKMKSYIFISNLVMLKIFFC